VREFCLNEIFQNEDLILVVYNDFEYNLGSQFYQDDLNTEVVFSERPNDWFYVVQEVHSLNNISHISCKSTKHLLHKQKHKIKHKVMKLTEANFTII